MQLCWFWSAAASLRYSVYLGLYAVAYKLSRVANQKSVFLCPCMVITSLTDLEAAHLLIYCHNRCHCKSYITNYTSISLVLATAISRSRSLECQNVILLTTLNWPLTLQRHSLAPLSSLTNKSKYRNGLLPMQYMFLIRSSAGGNKYITRWRARNRFYFYC